ncbi:hypothetical protein LEMLEM_LOCUS27084, partial [Lemmus lemmus]
VWVTQKWLLDLLADAGGSPRIFTISGHRLDNNYQKESLADEVQTDLELLVILPVSLVQQPGTPGMFFFSHLQDLVIPSEHWIELPRSS